MRRTVVVPIGTVEAALSFGTVVSRPPHCRIGKIKFKSGGSMQLLQTAAGSFPRNERMISYGQQTALRRGSDLAGFIILAWGERGAYTICGDGLGSPPIPLNLLPAWVEEAVRRAFVTAAEVHDILDGG